MNHGWNGSPGRTLQADLAGRRPPGGDLPGRMDYHREYRWRFFMEGQMARENVWTGEARRVLYQQLVKRFGPLKSWKNVSSPGGKLDEQFEKFCTTFADAIGAKSGDAVQHQIRFALPETSKGSTWT